MKKKIPRNPSFISEMDVFSAEVGLFLCRETKNMGSNIPGRVLVDLPIEENIFLKLVELEEWRKLSIYLLSNLRKLNGAEKMIDYLKNYLSKLMLLKKMKNVAVDSVCCKDDKEQLDVEKVKAKERALVMSDQYDKEIKEFEKFMKAEFLPPVENIKKKLKLLKLSKSITSEKTIHVANTKERIIFNNVPPISSINKIVRKPPTATVVPRMIPPTIHVAPPPFAVQPIVQPLLYTAPQPISNMKRGRAVEDRLFSQYSEPPQKKRRTEYPGLPPTPHLRSLEDLEKLGPLSISQNSRGVRESSLYRQSKRDLDFGVITKAVYIENVENDTEYYAIKTLSWKEFGKWSEILHSFHFAGRYKYLLLCFKDYRMARVVREKLYYVLRDGNMSNSRKFKSNIHLSKRTLEFHPNVRILLTDTNMSSFSPVFQKLEEFRNFFRKKNQVDMEVKSGNSGVRKRDGKYFQWYELFFRYADTGKDARIDLTLRLFEQVFLSVGEYVKQYAFDQGGSDPKKDDAFKVALCVGDRSKIRDVERNKVMFQRISIVELWRQLSTYGAITRLCRNKEIIYAEFGCFFDALRFWKKHWKNGMQVPVQGGYAQCFVHAEMLMEDTLKFYGFPTNSRRRKY